MNDRLAISIGVVIVVMFATISVPRMFRCWDAGGEYVRGVSWTGYVCLPGVKK